MSRVHPPAIGALEPTSDATRVGVADVGIVPRVENARERRRGRAFEAGKRVVDLVGASILLVLLSPFILVIAVAIRVDSAGSVLFRQKRLGQGGREFNLYKFRTMHVGADRERAGLAHLNFLPPPAFKILRDPRVTKVGAFLRTWSLDEIPNLFNVLRGDMSLVGPRPNSWGLQTYEDWQLPRLSIRPGVTGPGQVAGRGNLSFDEHVRLDLQYVRTRSLWLDLKILGRTVLSVLCRRGAY